MCGICGIIGSPDPVLLGRMLDLLAHRGPDEQGVETTPTAAIGARRLAIVDVEDGRQPATSEDGRISAVLNGELYNYRALQSLLERRGHRLRSRSDTEVLPHLYEEFGSAFLPLLRGMFAIAIWDEQEQRLLLARDRLGEKPLYHARTRDDFVFASELTSVLAHPAVSRDLDPLALRLYLTLHYVPGPRTIVAGVEKLPPGHSLSFEKGATQLRRYWDVVPGTGAHLLTKSAAAQELRSLLEDAVATQLHAERPLGALLSGGLDSAAIVGLMSRLSPEPPRTFTVGFAQTALDERPEARAVAAAFGTQHTELVVEQPTLDDFRLLVRHLDEPLGDQAALPMFLIARTASEHVTVLLTGEGSDELFGGYPRYRWFGRALELERIPRAIKGPLRSLLAAGGCEREAELLLGEGEPLARHVAWTRVFSAAESAELLTPDYAGLAEADAIEQLRALLAGWEGVDPVEQAMIVDLRSWLVDDVLTKADRVTMAWSIEARAPYLDHRIVEFATSLPLAARGSAKALLRSAFVDLLPARQLAGEKHAFRAPLAEWLGGALGRDVRALLLATDSPLRGIVRRDELVRLLGHDRGGAAGRQLWTLAVLELWLRTFVQGPA